VVVSEMKTFTLPSGKTECRVKMVNSWGELNAFFNADGWISLAEFSKIVAQDTSAPDGSYHVSHLEDSKAGEQLVSHSKDYVFEGTAGPNAALKTGHFEGTLGSFAIGTDDQRDGQRIGARNQADDGAVHGRVPGLATL
jgi:hypothetical protein